jgi:hypothetical protein
LRKPLSFEVHNQLSVFLEMEKQRREEDFEERFFMADIEKELAEYCGVKREAIYGIKRGVSSPSLPLALKIAQYYGVEVEDIFYVFDKKTKQVEMELIPK